MLKIIDNYDLKHLKIYGFTLKFNVDTGELKYCRYENKLHLRTHYYEVDVDVKTRILTTRLHCEYSLYDTHCDIEEVFESLIFQMTKDGIIEEV